MSNPITGVHNDKVSIQQPQQLEMLIVDIKNILDHQFLDPTVPMQASASGTIRKERPSIFYSNRFSVGVASYDPNGGREHEMWKYVAFMNRWLDFNIDLYLKYMKQNEDVALSYYIEKDRNNLSSNSNNFLEFLMVCSCFLCFVILLFQKVENGIEILKGSHRRDNSDPTEKRIQQFSILSPSIMQNPVQIKLEMLYDYNQIPWLAVEAVFTNSDLSKLCSTRIDRLAISCFDDIYPRANKSKVQGDIFPSGGFKHLLHMFHWTRTPHGKFFVDPQSAKSSAGFYIPSAVDLTGSATDFKKIASGCDVLYCNKRLSGLIQITTLHIFSYSRDLFSELLDFEQKYMECGLPITAYIACMDSLLKTKDDVKLLRKNGIVGNTLKDEKEVLNFVSYLRTRISRIPNDLSILSDMVIEHHEKSISREYYELKSQYCPNRWVVISVTAAFVLFVLTFIQTVYTALGYYTT